MNAWDPSPFDVKPEHRGSEKSALARRKKLLSNSDQHLFQCRGFMPLFSAGGDARPRHKALENLRTITESPPAVTRIRSGSRHRHRPSSCSRPQIRRSSSSYAGSSVGGTTARSVSSSRRSSSSRISSGDWSSMRSNSPAADSAISSSYSGGRFSPGPAPSQKHIVIRREEQHRRRNSYSGVATAANPVVPPLSYPVVKRSTSVRRKSTSLTTSSTTTDAAASVVVQERIIVVTPRIKITRTSPTPDSGAPDNMTKELAEIANSIKPIKPYNAPSPASEPASPVRTSSQVTSLTRLV